MAVTRRYGDRSLQVVTTPELKEEIEKIAELEGVSKASVIRDAIAAGMPSRRATHTRRMKKKTDDESES